jgi:hypothetical protein
LVQQIKCRLHPCGQAAAAAAISRIKHKFIKTLGSSAAVPAAPLAVASGAAAAAAPVAVSRQAAYLLQ